MHTNIYVHAHKHIYTLTHTHTHVDALYSYCITGYCQGIIFSQIGLIVVIHEIFTDQEQFTHNNYSLY